MLEMTAQAGGLRRSFSLSGLGEQALADGVLYRASELFQQGLRINFALDEPLGIAVALDSLGRTALASVAETVPRHCSVSAGQGSAHATTAGQLTMSPDPRLCTNLPHGARTVARGYATTAFTLPRDTVATPLTTARRPWSRP